MASVGRVISEMLNESHQGRTSSSRMQGGMIAKVVDNVDPEDRYRVRLSFPWLSDAYSKETTSDGSDSKVQSHWARITTMMSGQGMGSFWLPEIDDEVMVEFEEGDFSRPIVMGSLWNGEKSSPRSMTFSPENKEIETSNLAQGGKNDYRFFRSRSGHMFAFIDTEDGGGISLRSAKNAELFIDDADQRVCLYDMNQDQWLTIDTKNKKITLETDTGDILIKAKEKIRLECKNLEIEAEKGIDIKAGETIKQECKDYKSKSSTSTNMDGGSKMVCKAVRIDLNP